MAGSSDDRLPLGTSRTSLSASDSASVPGSKRCSRDELVPNNRLSGSVGDGPLVFATMSSGRFEVGQHSATLQGSRTPPRRSTMEDRQAPPTPQLKRTVSDASVNGPKQNLLSPLSPWEALQSTPGMRLRSSFSSTRGSEVSMQELGTVKRASFSDSIRRNSFTMDIPSARRGSITSALSMQSAGSSGGELPAKMHSSSTTKGFFKEEMMDSDAPARWYFPANLGQRTYNAMRSLVESRVFSTSMFLLSIYVLFGDDLRLAIFSKDADDVFNGITIFAILLFTFELVVTSIVSSDYFLSFFCFLDVVSTISLILDLTFVWEALLGYDSIRRETNAAGENVSEQSDYARAGRSSRVGTRVARILRVFRLIRMARMVKVANTSKRKNDARNKLKSKMRASQRRPFNEAGEPGQAATVDDLNTSGESRVGKKLSDRTTLWVIMLVLAMLMILPILDSGDSEDEMMNNSAQFGSDVLDQAWRNLMANQTQHNRVEWETQVLLYTYYHNYYAKCPDVTTGTQSCASESLAKLCFLGYVTEAGSSSYPRDTHIQEMPPDSTNWDVMFTGSNNDWQQNDYILGEVPQDIKWRLARPWQTECKVYDATVFGVSLMREEPCPWRTFRPQETVRYFPALRARDQDGANEGELLLLFDVSKRSRWEAVMSMIRMVFIIIALTCGAIFFSADADNLVLHPIERMISRVEMIRKNPLYAIKLGDDQLFEQTVEESIAQRTVLGRIKNFFKNLSGAKNSKKDRKRRRRSTTGVADAEKKVTLETKILENTIIKLGSLLALGFGEAGTEIIGHNLDDRGVGVDAMIPGRKVEAIYGYCQIKDFNITTEVLQEKTMVFVNQVAEIVHRIVDEHLGAANKNVGEAFLLVWRVGLYEEDLRSKIADLSVASFIQVMSAVSRDQQLAEYGSHPALLAKLSSYRVSLGFGLHLGWAIEGAIGSEFKIEASYLSSHVNMAMCLETVTKHYSVMMLMSEALVRACSKSFAYYFRAVDNLMLEGSKAPTRIFAVDLDCRAVAPVETEEKRKKKGYKYRDRHQRELVKLGKLDADYEVSDLFSSDKYIKKMRAPYTLDFCQEFEKGYVNYEAGEWDVAAGIFEATSGMLEGIEDGPSNTLLEYMRIFDFQAPPQWPGYRTLRSGQDLLDEPVPSINVVVNATG